MNRPTNRRGIAIVACIAGLATHALARPDLYNNGPFITSPGQGTGGADVSLLQTNLGFTSFGFNCQQIPTNARLADDFLVPAGGWTLTSFVVYAFQANAPTSPPTISTLRLRIWNGRPGDAGSQAVFGDMTTNRLASIEWANAYRAPDTDPSLTTRAIFRIEAAISPPLSLAPGTYWLEWQASGSLPSGPWSVPVTVMGSTGSPDANARWFDGSAWSDLRDGSTHTRQELSFIIRGTGGTAPGCYANCDGSTAAPILNVNDFICFQTKFAASDTYANCDGSTSQPVLNVNDFICFQTAFAGGCTAP